MAATVLPAALEAMRRQRVIPVIRAERPTSGSERVLRCLDAGLRVVELTTTIPGWLEVLERARAAFPDALLGVGTTTTSEQAISAVQAGAAFLVSPRLAPEVREVGTTTGTPVIEGGLTLTELVAAGSSGVAKLFPAHLVTPAYLRSIAQVEPALCVMPTGGIALREVDQWLAAGAFAVGVGSDLTSSPDLAQTLAELRTDSAA
jgi:2-dehydro-3-deoxyphosphogluconate aldolase / (4S)-4-hydroxy-2-oxoglutarate aldolase